MKKTRLTATIVIATWAALAGACGAHGPPIASCNSNDDCGSEDRCVDGACVNATTEKPPTTTPVDPTDRGPLPVGPADPEDPEDPEAPEDPEDPDEPAGPPRVVAQGLTAGSAHASGATLRVRARLLDVGTRAASSSLQVTSLR